MSRSAHAQGGVKLRELPRCSRCKQQFVLVTARYEDSKGKGHIVEEWECEKCNKIVPKELLKEEPMSEEDKFLHKKVKELQDVRRKEKERDRKTTLRKNIRNRDSK